MITILDGDYNSQRFKFFAGGPEDNEIVDMIGQGLMALVLGNKIDCEIKKDGRVTIVKTKRMIDMACVTSYFGQTYYSYTDRALN